MTKNTDKSKVMYLPIGLVIGAGLGAAFNQVAFGVAFGLMVGAIIDLMVSRKGEKCWRFCLHRLLTSRQAT